MIIVFVLVIFVGIFFNINVLLFGDDVFLGWFMDSLIILGVVLVLCVMLVLGGMLLVGFGSLELGMRIMIGILVICLVLLLLIGIGVVLFVYKLGVNFYGDKMLMFVFLL